MHLSASTAYSMYVMALEKCSRENTPGNRLRVDRLFRQYLDALKREQANREKAN